MLKNGVLVILINFFLIKKNAKNLTNFKLFLLDCAIALNGLVQADASNYARNLDIPYPQNSLRNLARENIMTKLFYLVDIDTVPSGDLRYQFNKFAKRVRKLIFVTGSGILSKF